MKRRKTSPCSRLGCSASLVDELELKGGGGSFLIGWERDYSGRLVPAGQGGVTAAVHGFDTYVIGSDPEKRDYPLIQLLNSTQERRRSPSAMNCNRR